MHTELPIYFGSDAQKAMLRRGADVHKVVGGLPHYTYYGRSVGVSAPKDVPFSTFLSLARLQGNSSCANVPDEDVAGLTSDLASEGLTSTHYARWDSTHETLARADDVIKAHKSDDQTRLVWLSPETDAQIRHSMAKTSLECGVLPPSLAVLFGGTQPGVCPMLVDQDNTVIALAASAAYWHPDHPLGRTTCWWGMLAVQPEYRGKGLSLLLGAYAMCAMRDRFGFSRFFTGVAPGNKPSEAVCSKMDLRHEGYSVIAAADPGILPGGRMTK